MALSIELPPSLEQDLASEAEREGVSVSEQATFFLQLMIALTREGRKTSFRGVVQDHLRQNSLDADRLAETVEKLSVEYLPKSTKSAIETERTIAMPEVIDRKDRISILGKYAYLGGGTEEFMREKQLEIDREDRR